MSPAIIIVEQILILILAVVVLPIASFKAGFFFALIAANGRIKNWIQEVKGAPPGWRLKEPTSRLLANIFAIEGVTLRACLPGFKKDEKADVIISSAFPAPEYEQDDVEKA